MQMWTQSAMNAYYSDPIVRFFNAGDCDAKGIRVASAGYYIILHCYPDCGEDFEKIAKAGFGPFDTKGRAVAWSRQNLVEETRALTKARQAQPQAARGA